jgi:hypothetical protein
MVVNKMPIIANESLEKLHEFLSNDMKNYLAEAKTELKTIKLDSDKILDATLQKSFIKVFKKLDGNLVQLIDEITNSKY